MHSAIQMTDVTFLGCWWLLLQGNLCRCQRFLQTLPEMSVYKLSTTEASCRATPNTSHYKVRHRVGMLLLVPSPRPDRAISIESPLVITFRSGLRLLPCLQRRQLQLQASCLTPFASKSGVFTTCLGDLGHWYLHFYTPLTDLKLAPKCLFSWVVCNDIEIYSRGVQENHNLPPLFWKGVL